MHSLIDRVNRWLLKRQPDLIVSRLEQSMKEAEQGRSKGAVSSKTCYTRNNDNRNCSGKITYRTRISLIFGSMVTYSTENGGATRHNIELNSPNWFTQKAWSIVASSSCSGFHINLRTYNVVSYNAPVMRLAYRGDIPGLLDLFDRKLASPFDISELGYRLIDASITLTFISLATLTKY